MTRSKPTLSSKTVAMRLPVMSGKVLIQAQAEVVATLV